ANAALIHHFRGAPTRRRRRSQLTTTKLSFSFISGASRPPQIHPSLLPLCRSFRSLHSFFILAASAVGFKDWLDHELHSIILFVALSMCQLPSRLIKTKSSPESEPCSPENAT